MRESRRKQKKLEERRLQKPIREKEKQERKQRELLEQKKKTIGNRVRRLVDLSEEEYLAKTQIKVGFRGLLGDFFSGISLLIFFSVIFYVLFIDKSVSYGKIIALLWFIYFLFMTYFFIVDERRLLSLYFGDIPVIVLTPEGIENRRLNVFVRWENIKTIEYRYYRGKRVVAEFVDTDAYSSQLSSLRRKLFNIFYTASADLVSSEDSMQFKVEEVYETMKELHLRDKRE